MSVLGGPGSTAANTHEHMRPSNETRKREWATFILERMGIESSAASLHQAAEPFEYLGQLARNQGLLAKVITLSWNDPGEMVIQKVLESGAILLMPRSACMGLPKQFDNARFVVARPMHLLRDAPTYVCLECESPRASLLGMAISEFVKSLAPSARILSVKRN